MSPYKLDFKVPAGITAGDTYDVRVYNGYGGQSSISNWIQIRISDHTPSALSTIVLTQGWLDANIPGDILYNDGSQNLVSINVVQDAINYAHNIWVSVELTDTSCSYLHSYVVLQLPAGTISLASALGPMQMLSHVHLSGADDDLSPTAGTVVAGGGTNLICLLDFGEIKYDSDVAVSIANIYFLANSDLKDNAVLHDLGNGGTVDGLTLDNVTIDARNAIANRAGWDVILNSTSTHTQFLNSTFYGQGIQICAGNDMIVDNCIFFGCGEGAGTGMQIDVTKGQRVSVTRCTDQSLVNDISNPGLNIDFNSASRLIDVQGTSGYMYIGDNTTTDLYQFAAEDINGGEQILNESSGRVDYTGLVNRTIDDGQTISGFSYQSITLSAAPAGNPTYLVGDVVLITAGPGMGESRTIVEPDGTLNMPWGVVPTNLSRFTISLACTADAVYQNNLSGDGALSLVANASCIQIGGIDLSIDGNDVRNEPIGIEFSNTYNESFSLIEHNSIECVTAGIAMDTSFAGGIAGSTPVAWCVGNVFRDNIINGPGTIIPFGPVRVAAGISISGDGTNDIAGGLTNVVDQDIIADFRVGIQLVFDGHAGTSGSGGIVDTVISNCFFSSDGSDGSYGITTIHFAYQVGGIVNYDADPYYLLPNSDFWQNFWN